MEYDDKVFVIATGKVETNQIQSVISCKGVVTGYVLRSAMQMVNKKDVFTDEEKAKKALFLKKLKKEEEGKKPAEDKKGDRHWIPGFKKRRW